MRSRFAAWGSVLAAGALLLGASQAGGGGAKQAAPRAFPQLSSVALDSAFALENNIGAEGASFSTGNEPQNANAPAAGQVNADYNTRPQNETTIATDPNNPARSVIAANDYGIGDALGGVYTSDGVTYFPPFPLLAGVKGNRIVSTSNAVAGDPALAYDTAGHAYLATIAFHRTFCQNGVFVYRSTSNGESWTRPVVPDLLPPEGLRTVVYWNKQDDCTVFHDKEWITVDNTGGPHNGRIYVTWVRYVFHGARYIESPIKLAYSDDLGDTFSKPIEISGESFLLCFNQSNGPKGVCDEDQAPVPVVLPDGKVATAFINQQGAGFNEGFRNQYLVTVWDPDDGSLAGPYKVADLKDGLNDYPANAFGDLTLCNANFRQWGAGNIAVGRNGALYVAYSDDAKHAGEFPYPTEVDPSPPYACPAGKETDADVYVWKSTDGGVHWRNITPTAAQAVHDQWFPWVAADDAGHVSVLFFDRSYDPGNKLGDATLVQSSNGGNAWSKTTKVSDVSSNFDNAFPGCNCFIGDYNGNTVDRDGVSHPVWTGVNPGQTESDVFTAAVTP